MKGTAGSMKALAILKFVITNLMQTSESNSSLPVDNLRALVHSSLISRICLPYNTDPDLGGKVQDGVKTEV